MLLVPTLHPNTQHMSSAAVSGRELYNGPHYHSARRFARQGVSATKGSVGALANDDRQPIGTCNFITRPVVFVHYSDPGNWQKQRVALARSLVTEPQLLLLDEPLSALDAHLVIRMQGVLTRLQRELGITFVYVTHSHSEVFAMTDRVVIMSQGEIAQIGKPREIYRAPANRFVAEFVGRNNILTGTIDAIEGNRATLNTAVGHFSALIESNHLTTGDAASIVIAADMVRIA